MHWSWSIVNSNANPQAIPEMGGVDIQWDHYTSEGSYSSSASKDAAQEMANAYGIRNLRVVPSLNSKHIQGNAIDMTISWSGTLAITNATGQTVNITTNPRSGMNSNLHRVGASYGVLKFVGGESDMPHWSNNGH